MVFGINLELLKKGYIFSWINLIGLILIVLVSSIIIYWIATGQDSFSVDNKNFQYAKSDCRKLRDYLLIYPDDWHSDEVRSLYLVNCK